MFNLEFILEGNTIAIQMDGNEPMEKATEKFFFKTGEEMSSTYFLYNGTQMNLSEKILNIANKFDKENKKMMIVAQIMDTSFFRKDVKNIICPKCKEICFFNMNNYKISLNNCKNKHQTENVLISDFETQQKIDLKTIVCDICKIKDKETSNNKMFYKCFKCNMNICPQCKAGHDRTHKIIDYDDKDYKCSKHIQLFISYCKTCNENLCPLCQDEHNGHEIIDFNDIMPDESSLEKNLKELKKKIGLLKKELNKIKYTLDYILKNMEQYYKINEQIINNFEENRRNYQVLNNIKELNNTYLFKDIDEILSTENISVKIINILDVFHKMNNMFDEISIIYDVDNKVEEMRIFSDIFVHNNKEICQMVIDDKVSELKTTFNTKDYKKKELKIKLKNIEKCYDFNKMLDGCKSLSSLPEFYKLNTISINVMLELLKKCYESFFKDNAPKWLVNNLIHLLLKKKKNSDIEYKKIEKVYDQLEDEYYISTIMNVEQVIEKIIDLNCNYEEINKWVNESMENMEN